MKRILMTIAALSLLVSATLVEGAMNVCGASTGAGEFCCVGSGQHKGLCLKGAGNGHFYYVYDGTPDAANCHCSN